MPPGADAPAVPPTPPGASEPTDPAPESESGSAPSHSGPQVDAVHCPAGHPNPPAAQVCRACAADIVDRTVTEIERPTLGRLARADGDDITLDQPVLIGRKPPESAIIDGVEAHVVTIADADTALSRSHAQIRLDGWDVEVVDLGSTNHTYVTIPGDDPVELQPNEPFTVPVGAVVSLGAAVRLTYEV